MKLTIQRDTFTENSTTGVLSVDGEQFGYTLEPRSDRSLGKPYCIPQGDYRVTPDFSVRFQMLTPHLHDVPNFEAVEIHPGNFPADTEGCTLVGETRGVDFVGTSRPLFELLMAKLFGQAEIIAEYIGGPID